jgi:hypothetical protein
MDVTQDDQRVLWRAVSTLEREGFINRLTSLTGEPLTQILRALPKSIGRKVNAAVRKALRQALGAALYQIHEPGAFEPPSGVFKAASGFTGALSGFFGAPALLLELPITTMLMLRSIAGIAKAEGENLKELSARLACLEVLALAPTDHRTAAETTSYYAARTFLAKTVSEAAANFVERGVAGGAAPIIIDLISSIAPRFGIVVSEKVAAGAIPVVGAIGGAAVNLAFMDHFQQLARAHFAVRRLERTHGQDTVRQRYQYYARLIRQKKRPVASPSPRATRRLR